MQDDSLERALADIELLQAAYPDEIDFADASTSSCTTFPLHVTLRLDPAEDNNEGIIVLEFVDGYPTTSGVQIASYRSSNNKLRMDAATRALRQTADECLAEEMEGGFACCATAMKIWMDHAAIDNAAEQQELNEADARRREATAKLELSRSYDWISGEALVDRKSTFIAHLCYVSSEHEVKEALHQLISSSPKIQRASHNMYAWRLTEEMPGGSSVKKHDNDDDGEDAAGSRMAQLLHMRGDDGVLVVVSRWFGGIHLGPKRFAHIINVARDLLVSVSVSESSSSAPEQKDGRAISVQCSSTTAKTSNCKR